MSQKTTSTLLKVGSILLAAAFIMSGGMKLTGSEELVANFAKWGYPAWFLYFIGAAEVAGGIGLLIGGLSGLAATGLVLIMGGAFVTHLRVGEYGPAIAPLVLMVATFLVARARRSPVLVRLGLAAAT